MSEVFVLADDLTGALDTAVRFASQGISTCVVTGEATDLASEAKDATVLVQALPTRHMPCGRAYDAVFAATRKAMEAGIPFLYKKTDSVLRGNVGAELAAMLDASGAPRLDFLPAFPALDRSTRHGVQLLDGRPIEESVFREDPFEKIERSYIPEILAAQTGIACRVVEKGQTAIPSGRCICVYDADTDDDLREIARRVHREKGLRVMAGCAGLAGVLRDVIPLAGGRPRTLTPSRNLLVVCGSVNPIARRQLDYAQRHGFERFTLTAEQRLSADAIPDALVDRMTACYRAGQPCIIDINDGQDEAAKVEAGAYSLREQVAQTLGCLVKRLWRRGLHATILATGGDTLLAVLEAMECKSIRPAREVRPGIVLSECVCGEGSLSMISKAGGFGGETLLPELAAEFV